MSHLKSSRVACAAAVVLVFALGFLAGVLRGPGAPPALAAVAPAGNGDVNSDGGLDLSDAVYILTHLFQAGPAPLPIHCGAGNASTALVVRHAERFTEGADPCLTDQGKVRAEHLRDSLVRAKVDAIFATDYCRTAETVQPLAVARGLNALRLPTMDSLIGSLKALPPGSVAVVAGNSFNIPDIVEGLGATERVTVPGSEYDNLWVVHFPAGGGPGASLVHLRY